MQCEAEGESNNDEDDFKEDKNNECYYVD